MKNLIIGLVVAAAVVGCAKDEEVVDTSTTDDTSTTMTDDTSTTMTDTAATDETM